MVRSDRKSRNLSSVSVDRQSLRSGRSTARPGGLVRSPEDGVEPFYSSLKTVGLLARPVNLRHERVIHR